MSAPTPEERAEWRREAHQFCAPGIPCPADRLLALLDALETAEAQVAQVAADALAIDRERMEAEEKVQRVRAALLDSAPPINSELRYDGTEDPAGAAYLCGYKDAWDAVDAALADTSALTEAQDAREAAIDAADSVGVDEDWGVDS